MLPRVNIFSQIIISRKRGSEKLQFVDLVHIARSYNNFGLHSLAGVCANDNESRTKQRNWYALQIVCRTCFVAFRETFFCKTLSCFARRVVFMTNSKGFFARTEEINSGVKLWTSNE